MIELTDEEQVRMREAGRIRRALGLNQAEMGELIGKSWETVAAYEQGKRKISDRVWALVQRLDPAPLEVAKRKPPSRSA